MQQRPLPSSTSTTIRLSTTDTICSARRQEPGEERTHHSRKKPPPSAMRKKEKCHAVFFSKETPLRITSLLNEIICDWSVREQVGEERATPAAETFLRGVVLMQLMAQLLDPEKRRVLTYGCFDSLTKVTGTLFTSVASTQWVYNINFFRVRVKRGRIMDSVQSPLTEYVDPFPAV
ncbi:hypothetical protein J437_LFUL012967 [Ladona fulva]|uniref:Uncharacterized protein n=1 Tax=Ladona fulva TaxID=123851 RepID=A0A8K0KCS9_LADFU|nr:hypothetical protein J437_LFUL012967 [Ladona fulva]